MPTFTPPACAFSVWKEAILLALAAAVGGPAREEEGGVVAVAVASVKDLSKSLDETEPLGMLHRWWERWG